jgi:hypothetical protein
MSLQELEDRLYTSTEVANILGVSLRSVYRYLEDAKLIAEMKTATGRHRFTKQNILDFLSPQGGTKAAPVAAAPVAPVAPVAAAPAAPAEPVAAAPIPAPAETEDVDWLSKFRQAAEKYKTDQAPAETPAEPAAAPTPAPVEAVSGLAEEVPAAPVEPVTPVEPEVVADTSPSHFYKSSVGGLKDVAQNIDKSAKKASLEYAFTMDAGLSLHKPISPFSLIHSYVRSEDLAFFEKILDLSPTEMSEAQLCLIVSDDAAIYASKVEVHGLNVVANERLKADLVAAGKQDLANELT